MNGLHTNPVIPAGYPKQRYFTGGGALEGTPVRQKRYVSDPIIRVYRYAEHAHAELSLHFAPHGTIAVALDALELRDLAQRLLDAAHDIDANPAGATTTTGELA